MLRKTLFRAAVASSFTAFGYLGYKSYQKSIKHPPFLKFSANEEAKFDKTTIQYNLKTRSDHFKDVSTSDYDVLIIGGGCNGAGVLLEAASRGLKCLLIDDNDFASGTSSKSTKLIHGGVRYLEQAFSWDQTDRKEKLDLVAEALHERSYMIQNAQYMNKPLPIIIPSDSLFRTIYYYAGSLVYHLIYYCLDDNRNLALLPFPYIIGEKELQSIYPKLNPDMKYGVVYYDGQMNDSRMNMDILLTSTLDKYILNEKTTPANIVNYTRFTDFIKDDKGKITGGVIHDKLNDKSYKIKAKAVVNCTGIFADTIRKLDDPNVDTRIVPAQGSHLVLEKDLVHKKYGLLIPKTTDGRVLFILPWLRYALIGTTEHQKDKPELDPTVSFDDMIFLVKEISRLFTKLDVTEISSGIKSKWAGARPLVKDENAVADQYGRYDTKSFARRHVIEKSKSGLISLMGGKWTIYRRMGEETVDEILKQMKENGYNVEGIRPTSITRELRLLGQYKKNLGPLTDIERKTIKLQTVDFLTQRYKVPVDVAKHLHKTYGERAFDVAKYFDNEKNRERIHEKHPYTIGELKYTIRYEMSMRPDDFIFRRTRLGFVDSESIYQVFPKIMDIYASEYQWSDEKKVKEIKDSFEKIKKMNF